MNKSIIIIYFLLATISSLAQNKITYKAALLENYFSDDMIKKSSSSKIKSFYKQMNIGIEKHIDDFEFILKYDKEESFFTMEEQLEIETNKMHKAAYIAVKGKDKFYMNVITNQKLKQTVAFGEKFLIQSNINSLQWERHKETKKIQNYLCNKATTIKKVVNSKGTFEKLVVAWYTLQIPIGQGPRGYGGLPGLILELQEDKIIYSASKIGLNKKSKKGIRKPSKGKLVTEKEYEAIVLGLDWNYGG